VEARGVLPPEACIAPADFLALAPEFLPRGSGDSEGGIIFESVAADGTVTRSRL